ETELLGNLASATSQKDPVKLLMIGGHGAQEQTMLGARFRDKDVACQYDTACIADRLSDPDGQYLDVEDGPKLQKGAPRLWLARDAWLILKSCYTGSGKGDQSNVANTLHAAFPRFHLFAPTIATNSTVELSETGELISPGFMGGSSVTYDIPSSQRF